MTSLTEEARGPFVYSMLDGAALTVEFAEFAVDGGELIFKIIEARYPDKDPIDRAGKAFPFAPAPLKHLKSPFCIRRRHHLHCCLYTCLRKLRSQIWAQAVLNFFTEKRILGGVQITHQQFKSSADLDETDTNSQQQQITSTR